MELKLNNIRSSAATVEDAARMLVGSRSWTYSSTVNGVEIDRSSTKTIEDATDAVAAAMAAGDWYWLNGSAYCPACVECESPAIDAAAPNVQRGGAVSVCTCCGTDYNA